MLKDVYFGVNLKIIEQQISHISARGVAFDCGMLIGVSDNFFLGMSLLNVGQKMKFMKEEVPFPTRLTFGASCCVSALTIAADMNFPFNNKPSFNFGADCPLSNIFFLRAGAIVGDKMVRLSCGFGLEFKNYNFDYAFLPFNDLGTMHLIAMNMYFGRKGGKK
jgi:hypothetical protein